MEVKALTVGVFGTVVDWRGYGPAQIVMVAAFAVERWIDLVAAGFRALADAPGVRA